MRDTSTRPASSHPRFIRPTSAYPADPTPPRPTSILTAAADTSARWASGHEADSADRNSEKCASEGQYEYEDDDKSDGVHLLGTVRRRFRAEEYIKQVGLMAVGGPRWGRLHDVPSDQKDYS
jgi:hypothetical protein